MYCEPVKRSAYPVWFVYSEDAIMAEYWETWKRRVISYNRAHGLEDDANIDPNRCIDDWVTIRWAVEATTESLANIIRENNF